MRSLQPPALSHLKHWRFLSQAYPRILEDSFLQCLGSKGPLKLAHICPIAEEQNAATTQRFVSTSHEGAVS